MHQELRTAALSAQIRLMNGTAQAGSPKHDRALRQGLAVPSWVVLCLIYRLLPYPTGPSQAMGSMGSIHICKRMQAFFYPDGETCGDPSGWTEA